MRFFKPYIRKEGFAAPYPFFAFYYLPGSCLSFNCRNQTSLAARKKSKPITLSLAGIYAKTKGPPLDKGVTYVYLLFYNF